MNFYSADETPIGAEWLEISESERMRLILSFHVSIKTRGPNLKGHCAIHCIVENQIAQGYGPSKKALTRLIEEGLSRHDAVHAIGSVNAAFSLGLIRNPKLIDSAELHRKLNESIEGLTAESWRGKIESQ